MIEDAQRLVESIADLAGADDGEVGVDVHGPRPWHEEELGGEIREIVGGEHVRCLAIQREEPAREVARVPGEQSLRLSRRGVYVAAKVTDGEGITFENADCFTVGHSELLLHVRLQASTMPYQASVSSRRDAAGAGEEPLEAQRQRSVTLAAYPAAQVGGHDVLPALN